MRYLFKHRFLATLCVAMLLVATVGCSQPSKQITITVWHYYNGPQQSAFSSLVTKYNETVGKQVGVTIVASAQGSIGQLTQKVLDSATGKGTDTVPNIFAAYSDTAFEVDKLGILAPLDGYLTTDQLAKYIPGYIDEGRFDTEGSLKIFPIAKSTELLYLNKTYWEPFAAATGATYDDLATIEGLTATAANYYKWSNGMAFFGRDSMANYMYLGAKQLGVDLLSPNDDGSIHTNLDTAVLRKLWDNFYTPYISGHFNHLGKFRNDDVKTGDIIAFVGSSSAASFLPTQVIDANNATHNIVIVALPPPQFAEGGNYAVQQGAGMVVTKSSSYVEEACVNFLHWLTQPEQNLQFAVDSGYMPVTIAASSDKAFHQSINKEDANHGLATAIGITETASMYTPKIFDKSSSARSVLESSLMNFSRDARTELDIMLSTGISRDQAVEQLLQTARHEQWLSSLGTELAHAID